MGDDLDATPLHPLENLGLGIEAPPSKFQVGNGAVFGVFLNGAAGEAEEQGDLNLIHDFRVVGRLGNGLFAIEHRRILSK